MVMSSRILPMPIVSRIPKNQMVKVQYVKYKIRFLLRDVLIEKCSSSKFVPMAISILTNDMDSSAINSYHWLFGSSGGHYLTYGSNLFPNNVPYHGTKGILFGNGA